MKTNLIITLIQIVLCVAFYAGIVLIFSDAIRVAFARNRLKHRLTSKKERTPVTEWASMLISTAFGKNIDGIWLLLLESMIFIIAFLMMIPTFSFAMALIMAIVIAAMPLGVIFAKFVFAQNKGSREGINLLSELYRQYKMCELNIYEALEKTVSSSNDFPICKKQLYILLIKLRDASGRSEIKKYCRQFGESLGSVWGSMLASCIESAAYSGTDISLGLLDITDQLKEAKARSEERKHLNGESMRMTLFLVPLLYIGTMFVSVKYLDMSVMEFMRNQFLTYEGMLFFVLMVVLFLLNVIILTIVGNTKMDF